MGSVSHRGGVSDETQTWLTFSNLTKHESESASNSVVGEESLERASLRSWLWMSNSWLAHWMYENKTTDMIDQHADKRFKPAFIPKKILTGYTYFKGQFITPTLLFREYPLSCY